MKGRLRMVILIGGAPRAGKGIIARRLVTKTSMQLLSLDILKMGLYRTAPSWGVDPSAPSTEVGEKMWPLLRNMAENALETGVECIFEGDMLLPAHAKELRVLEKDRVRACFVGYSEIEPGRKLAEIREHAGHPNDWLNEHGDQEILSLVHYGIDFSRHLRRECARMGVEYFDSSEDFEGTIETVVKYLMPRGEGSPGHR